MPTTAPEKPAFIRVRLRPDLRDELKAIAADEHRSLPGQINHLLTLILSDLKARES